MKKYIIASGFFLLLSVILAATLIKRVGQQIQPESPARASKRSESVKNSAPKRREAPAPELSAGRPADFSKAEATMIAVGDIMLSRNVAAKISKYGDFDYPFASTSAMFNSVDFVFGNLESPITQGPRVPTGSFIFHADPGVENALAAANFKILSLANNHLPNYGAKGIADTIKYLDVVGIAHAGAGKNLAVASRPAFLEIKGIRFAFLAYNDRDVAPFGYGAATSSAGTALMDLAAMQAAVGDAKKIADLVIVSMHSGREYTEELTAAQTEFAHAAIDAGAELVLGHHPHVTQRVEKYRGKYIFYSLGNFIFDQMWSEETRRGIAVKFYFNRSGTMRAEVQPFLIMDYSRPVPAQQKIAEAVFQRLQIAPTDDFIRLLGAQ